MLDVPEGAQTIVLLLTGSIPKTKLDGLLTSSQIHDIIVEHGGHILCRSKKGRISIALMLER